MPSSWAKYHDICSLSDAFRTSAPLTDCLIHLRLTPTGRRWAGTAWPICSSSLQPLCAVKTAAAVSHKCPSGFFLSHHLHSHIQVMLKALQLTPRWEAGRQPMFLLIGQEKNRSRERDLDSLYMEDRFPFSRSQGSCEKPQWHSPETRSVCNLWSSVTAERGKNEGEKWFSSSGALYEVNVPFLTESLIKGGECLRRFGGFIHWLQMCLPSHFCFPALFKAWHM